MRRAPGAERPAPLAVAENATAAARPNHVKCDLRSASCLLGNVIRGQGSAEWQMSHLWLAGDMPRTGEASVDASGSPGNGPLRAVRVFRHISLSEVKTASLRPGIRPLWAFCLDARPQRGAEMEPRAEIRGGLREQDKGTWHPVRPGRGLFSVCTVAQPSADRHHTFRGIVPRPSGMPCRCWRSGGTAAPACSTLAGSRGGKLSGGKCSLLTSQGRKGSWQEIAVLTSNLPIISITLKNQDETTSGAEEV